MTGDLLLALGDAAQREMERLRKCINCQTCYAGNVSICPLSIINSPLFHQSQSLSLDS